MKIIGKGILLLIIAGILAVGYAFYVEPRILVTKTFEKKAKGAAGVGETTVVQISDVHYGEYFDEEMLAKVVDKVNREKPDIVVFTGDLYDIYTKSPETKPLIRQLGRIEAVVGKYAVWGNHDYGGGASRVYADIMEDSEFTLLKNSAVKVELSNEKTLSLGGVDDSLLGKGDITATNNGMKDADFQILMTHEPDIVEGIALPGVDLVLAGHSHGGQVRIPFVDPVGTTLAHQYKGGWYTIGEGTSMYVNSGIGTTKLPVRFLVPPQIAVFRIQW